VLVHCVSGISRSGAIATAYAMNTHQLSYEEALSTLRQHRPMIHPNSGFQQQIKTYFEAAEEHKASP
jgi:protein-tyrosine phosphatase